MVDERVLNHIADSSRDPKTPELKTYRPVILPLHPALFRNLAFETRAESRQIETNSNLWPTTGLWEEAETNDLKPERESYALFVGSYSAVRRYLKRSRVRRAITSAGVESSQLDSGMISSFKLHLFLESCSDALRSLPGTWEVLVRNLADRMFILVWAGDIGRILSAQKKLLWDATIGKFQGEPQRARDMIHRMLAREFANDSAFKGSLRPELIKATTSPEALAIRSVVAGPRDDRGHYPIDLGKLTSLVKAECDAAFDVIFSDNVLKPHPEAEAHKDKTAWQEWLRDDCLLDYRDLFPIADLVLNSNIATLTREQARNPEHKIQWNSTFRSNVTRRGFESQVPMPFIEEIPNTSARVHEMKHQLTVSSRVAYRLGKQLEGLNSGDGLANSDTLRLEEQFGFLSAEVERLQSQLEKKLALDGLILASTAAGFKQTWEIKRKISDARTVRVRRVSRSSSLFGLIRSISVWYETRRIPAAYAQEKLSFTPLDDYLAAKVPAEALKGWTTHKRRDQEKPENNKDKRVHLLSLSDGEYRDQDGIRLSEILDLCEDPAERLRHLLLIPKTTHEDTGDEQVTGWVAVHNPVRGRARLRSPRFLIRNRLRHTLTTDSGARVGPVVHSVNLFPDERRQVQLTTTTKIKERRRREEVLESARSSARSTSLRDALSTINESESRQSKTSTSSVSAGGGFGAGPWSASVSGSHSSTSSMSSREYAKLVTDQVRTAASKITEEHRSQIREVAETETEFEAAEVLSYELRNPSATRCCSYVFSELLREVVSRVAVVGTEFILATGEELVPGTGIEATYAGPLDTLQHHLVEWDPIEVKKLVDSLKAEWVMESATEGSSEGGDMDEDAVDERELYRLSTFVPTGAQVAELRMGEERVLGEFEQQRLATYGDELKAELALKRAQAKAMARTPVVLPDGLSTFSLENVTTDGEG